VAQVANNERAAFFMSKTSFEKSSRRTSTGVDVPALVRAIERPRMARRTNPLASCLSGVAWEDAAIAAFGGKDEVARYGFRH